MNRSPSFFQLAFYRYKQERLEDCYSFISLFLESHMKRMEKSIMEQFVQEQIDHMLSFAGWIYENRPQKSSIQNILELLNLIKEISNQTKRYQLGSNAAKILSIILSEQGNRLFQQGELVEAEKLYVQALKNDQRRSTTFFNLGACYFNMKEWRKALNAFENAKRLDPRNFKVNIHLSYTLDKLGEANQALEYVKSYLSQKPKDLGAVAHKASILRKLNLREEFRDCCRQILRQQPENEQFLSYFAQISLELNQMADVISFFKDKVDRNPHGAENYFNVGIIYKKAKMYEESIEWFRKGLLIQNNQSVCAEILSYYCHSEQKCLQFSFEMQERYPDNAQATKYLCKYFRKSNLLAQSVDLCETFLEYSPNNPEILQLLADCYQQLKLYTKSNQIYDRCLQLDPRQQNQINLFLKMADNYFSLSSYEKCSSMCNRILSFNPRSPQATFLIGCVHHNLKRESEALACFIETHDMDPTHYSSLYNIGNYYLRRNMYEEAIRYYEKALRINSNHVNSILNLGWAYSKIGKQEQSLEFIEKITKQNPDNSDGFLNLGIHLFERDRYRQALKQFARAFQLNQNSVIAIFYLAITYLCLNQNQLSLRYFKKAEHLKYRHEQFFTGYGLCLQRFKKYIEAFQCFIISLKMNSSQSELYYLLGDLIKECPEITEYEIHYAHFLKLEEETAEKYFQVGLFYKGQGDVNKFLTYFNNSLKILKNIHQRDKINGIRQINGFMQQSIELFRSLIRHLSIPWDEMILLGILYRDVGRNEEAEKYFRRVMDSPQLPGGRQAPPSLKFVLFYQAHLSTHNRSPDFLFLLAEFLLDRTLKDDAFEGMKAYAFFRNIFVDIEQQPSLNFTVARLRRESLHLAETAGVLADYLRQGGPAVQSVDWKAVRSAKGLSAREMAERCCVPLDEARLRERFAEILARDAADQIESVFAAEERFGEVDPRKAFAELSAKVGDSRAMARRRMEETARAFAADPLKSARVGEYAAALTGAVREYQSGAFLANEFVTVAFNALYFHFFEHESLSLKFLNELNRVYDEGTNFSNNAFRELFQRYSKLSSNENAFNSSSARPNSQLNSHILYANLNNQNISMIAQNGKTSFKNKDSTFEQKLKMTNRKSEQTNKEAFYHSSIFVRNITSKKIKHESHIDEYQESISKFLEDNEGNHSGIAMFLDDSDEEN